MYCKIKRFFKNIETNCLHVDTPNLKNSEMKKQEKAKQREEKRAMFEKMKSSKEINSNSNKEVEVKEAEDCFPVDLDEMFDVTN
jgi:Ca2+-dependent lipid-binding protein